MNEHPKKGQELEELAELLQTVVDRKQRTGQAEFTVEEQARYEALLAREDVRQQLRNRPDLTDIMREHYPKPILYICVLLLFTANTINLGVDLGAMAASCQMLLPLPFGIWLIAFALLTAVLEIFISYKQYARVLRLLTLSLLAYVFVAFAVVLALGVSELVLRHTVFGLAAEEMPTTEEPSRRRDHTVASSKSLKLLPGGGRGRRGPAAL